jgi:hypothetical protein
MATRRRQCSRLERRATRQALPDGTHERIGADRLLEDARDVQVIRDDIHSGDDDHRNVPHEGVGGDLGANRLAADAGQDKVEDDEIEGLHVQQTESLEAAASLDRIVAREDQGGLEEPAEILIVLHNQDPL